MTQQVIKGLLFSSNKSYMRKFKEGVLACHLENHLTKKQILTTYLNERMQEFKIPEDIFFGSVTQNGDYLGEGWCEKGIVLAFKKGTEPKR
ncbi:MAG: hypothetical protein DRH26_10370, partial [Deltaproteobacteria bacterium]